MEEVKSPEERIFDDVEKFNREVDAMNDAITATDNAAAIRNMIDNIRFLERERPKFKNAHDALPKRWRTATVVGSGPSLSLERIPKEFPIIAGATAVPFLARSYCVPDVVFVSDVSPVIAERLNEIPSYFSSILVLPVTTKLEPFFSVLREVFLYKPFLHKLHETEKSRAAQSNLNLLMHAGFPSVKDYIAQLGSVSVSMAAFTDLVNREGDGSVPIENVLFSGVDFSFAKDGAERVPQWNAVKGTYEPYEKEKNVIEIRGLKTSPILVFYALQLLNYIQSAALSVPQHFYALNAGGTTLLEKILPTWKKDNVPEMTIEDLFSEFSSTWKPAEDGNGEG